MLPEQIQAYRETVKLRDGATILLRPMTAADQAALTELLSQASDEDVRYLRDDMRDPEVIAHWCQTIDYLKVLPIVALVDDRIVGQATLHFRKGPRRHIGELRIFLAHDLRQRGLGTKMLKTLIELARKNNLQTLVAEIVVEQTRVIKAFQNLGFTMHCTYEDFFLLPDGDLRDTAILILPLRPKTLEF
jgi:L-amino acid N-acyltransferase YncA